MTVNKERMGSSELDIRFKGLSSIYIMWIYIEHIDVLCLPLSFLYLSAWILIALEHWRDASMGNALSGSQIFAMNE